MQRTDGVIRERRADARPGGGGQGLVAATPWLLGVATFPASLWIDRLFEEAGRPDLRQFEVAPGVLVLVAVTVVPGSADLRSKVDGGPLEFRGLDGMVLLASQLMPMFGMVAVVVAAASLVVRFRRAVGVERQQLRWVALAGGLSPVAAVAVLVGLLTSARAAVEWGLIGAASAWSWRSAPRPGAFQPARRRILLPRASAR